MGILQLLPGRLKLNQSQLNFFLRLLVFEYQANNDNCLLIFSIQKDLKKPHLVNSFLIKLPSFMEF